MSDEAKLLEDARRASIETLVQHLRGIHELDRVTADLRPAARAAPGAADAANDYLLGLARLFLGSYNAFLQFQSRHFDYVADRVRDLVKLYTPSDEGDVSDARLALREELDETAKGRFMLENVRRATADVSFCTSEFRSADGADRVSARVEIVPVAAAAARRGGSDRHVEPGTKRTFDLSVRLDPGLFRAGQRYFADTVVLSEGKVAARLALTLEVAPAGGRARPRAGKQGPAAKAGRRRGRGRA